MRHVGLGLFMIFIEFELQVKGAAVEKRLQRGDTTERVTARRLSCVKSAGSCFGETCIRGEHSVYCIFFFCVSEFECR